MPSCCVVGVLAGGRRTATTKSSPSVARVAWRLSLMSYTAGTPVQPRCEWLPPARQAFFCAVRLGAQRLPLLPLRSALARPHPMGTWFHPDTQGTLPGVSSSSVSSASQRSKLRSCEPPRFSRPPTHGTDQLVHQAP